MQLTPANLAGLASGFNMAFNKGFTGFESVWSRIAMKTTSIHADETYGWMKDIPTLREWIGPRVVQNLASAGYKIINRDFELTIGVDRNKIEDDSYGLFAPRFSEMGRAAAEHPDKLVFELLAAAFTSNCYDG